MLGKSQARKEDLRNTSVIEVIVAIIIALVVLIYGNDLDFATQKDAFQDRIATLLQEIESIKNELADLKKENLVLKKQNDELIRKNELLRQYVDAAAGQDEENRSLAERLLELEDKNAMLEDQLSKAIKKLKAAGKPTGLDKPFCRLPVVDPAMRQSHKWLGSVRFESSQIFFDISPLVDEKLAREIPGVEQLADLSPHTKSDFEKFADKANKHSRKQNPECRYFVEITLDPETTPAGLPLLVEKFFYRRVKTL